MGDTSAVRRDGRTFPPFVARFATFLCRCHISCQDSYAGLSGPAKGGVDNSGVAADFRSVNAGRPGRSYREGGTTSGSQAFAKYPLF
jgi:hypothetical protein